MMSEEKLLNNRYLLKTTIGRGGMAIVYLAEDRMLERDVAIKILKADYARDPAFRERFRQEAKAAANLSHPNIVPVYDFGYHERRLYIVMEYIPGTDLYTIIQEKGRLSTELGLDLSINQRRVEAIFNAVNEWCPDLGKLEVREIWRGLRPCSPDGLPIISRTDAYENLIVATGHAMIGMSLSPITGKLVSQLVANEPPQIDLSPLRIERFH